jgi:hypothetical protein
MDFMTTRHKKDKNLLKKNTPQIKSKEFYPTGYPLSLPETKQRQSFGSSQSNARQHLAINKTARRNLPLVNESKDGIKAGDG